MDFITKTRRKVARLQVKQRRGKVEHDEKQIYGLALKRNKLNNEAARMERKADIIEQTREAKDSIAKSRVKIKGDRSNDALGQGLSKFAHGTMKGLRKFQDWAKETNVGRSVRDD